MTAYATRSPLQLLPNTHNLMAEQRHPGRRTSARLREKDDAPTVNGTLNGQEKAKATSKQTKSGPNGVAAEGRTRPKRKLGTQKQLGICSKPILMPLLNGLRFLDRFGNLRN